MKFTKVFGLSLAHPYYSDNVCPDFAIEPTPSTVRLLANYRCVLKAGPGWVRAYNDPAGLWPDRGVAFTFRLRLQNPDFAQFTDLSSYAGTLAPVYTNAPADPPATPATSGPLNLTSRPQRQQERFAWGSASAGGTGRFKLGGRPLTDTAKQQLKVDGAGATATAAYDGAENAVAITGASAKAGDLVTISYYAQPVPRQDSFADAEIQVSFDRPNDQQPGLGDFQIDFNPRSGWWAYYLLTDATKSASNFKIVEELVDTNQPAGFVNSLPRDLVRPARPQEPQRGARPQGPHRGPACVALPHGGAHSISVGQPLAVPAVDGAKPQASPRIEPAGRPTAQPCAWPVHEIHRPGGGRVLPDYPDLTR